MIMLSQWLCPYRHCSVAVAWDDSTSTKEEVEKNGEEIYSSGQLNRQCGLCGNGLTPEHGKSIFDMLEEARLWLTLFQMRQMATRAMLLN